MVCNIWESHHCQFIVFIKFPRLRDQSHVFNFLQQFIFSSFHLDSMSSSCFEAVNGLNLWSWLRRLHHNPFTTWKWREFPCIGTGFNVIVSNFNGGYSKYDEEMRIHTWSTHLLAQTAMIFISHDIVVVTIILRTNCFR